MKIITVSKLKATCLAVLERVRKTGEPVLVTKRGVPIAQIVSAPPAKVTASTYGCMAGTAREVGNLVEPLPSDLWEALR